MAAALSPKREMWAGGYRGCRVPAGKQAMARDRVDRPPMPAHAGLDDLIDGRETRTEQRDRVVRSEAVEPTGGPRIGDIPGNRGRRFQSRRILRGRVSQGQDDPVGRENRAAAAGQSQGAGPFDELEVDDLVADQINPSA